MNKESTPKTTPSLGVVAISLNEERDLPAFIDHLRAWVDEIVIVDDGSSDRTAEIVDSGGRKMKFVSSPRSAGEYYSHQRNKGIAESSSDWLLHMDVDERVPPELAREIMEAIRDEGKDAYRYRRLNFFLHRSMRGGGWQNWNMVHLARRNALHFVGMYHEECVVNAPPERIGQLSGKMWHLNDECYGERMEKSIVYCREQSVRLAGKDMAVRWYHLFLLPLAEFLRKMVRWHGYRDGALGFLWSLHCSGAMFRACALLWDQQNPVRRDDLEERMSNLWRQSGMTKTQHE